MTMSANDVESIGDRLPSPAERKAANQLRQILTAHAKPDSTHTLKISGADNVPTEVILTPALSRLLNELLSHIGKGDTVNLLPVTQVLSTRQAADILNVPLSCFLSLMKSGAVRHDLDGRHQRVKAEDLFEYKQTRDTMRASALDKLAKIDMDSI